MAKHVKHVMPPPVAYTKAVALLQECIDIDEAKAFSDQAEALGVWARIYNQNDIGRQARQLRLHAYRRMGALARELAAKETRECGRRVGPVQVLRRAGLTKHQADAAHHLGKIDQDEHDILTKQKRPPAPTSVTKRFRDAKNITAYRMLKNKRDNPFTCGAYIKVYAPQRVAETLTPEEVSEAVKVTEHLVRWCQQFIRAASRVHHG